MLRQNFKVSRQILNNVSKEFFVSFSFSNKVLEIDKFTQRLTNKTYLTAEQYKKKLKQCPKPKSSFAINCKKLFFKSVPAKCKTTTASDDYLKARQFLKLRVKDMMKFVEDESQSITSSLKSRLENNKAARAAQLEKILQKTTCKLDELTSLDVSYGCWMRNKTMLLNDEIRRSFDALERAIVPNVEQIMSMLKDLQSDVSTCAARADKNIISCRKYVVPVEFAKCVNERLEEAALMLDLVSKESHFKLTEIVKFCETVMRAHEMTAQEVVQLNHTKSAELSKYLDRCIVKLKKASK